MSKWLQLTRAPCSLRGNLVGHPQGLPPQSSGLPVGAGLGIQGQTLSQSQTNRWKNIKPGDRLLLQVKAPTTPPHQWSPYLPPYRSLCPIKLGPEPGTGFTGNNQAPQAASRPLHCVVRKVQFPWSWERRHWTPAREGTKIRGEVWRGSQGWEGRESMIKNH